MANVKQCVSRELTYVCLLLALIYGVESSLFAHYLRAVQEAQLSQDNLVALALFAEDILINFFVAQNSIVRKACTLNTNHVRQVANYIIVEYLKKLGLIPDLENTLRATPAQNLLSDCKRHGLDKPSENTSIRYVFSNIARSKKPYPLKASERKSAVSQNFVNVLKRAHRHGMVLSRILVY